MFYYRPLMLQIESLGFVPLGQRHKDNGNGKIKQPAYYGYLYIGS
jgi:hypothetical protein